MLSHSLSTNHFQRSMNFITTATWFTLCQFSALVAFQWLWEDVKRKQLTEGRVDFSSESEKGGVTGIVTLPVVTGMWGIWPHISTVSKQREIEVVRCQSPFPLFLFQSETSVFRWCCTHLGWIFLSLLNFMEDTITSLPRIVSPRDSTFNEIVHRN